MAKLTVCFVRAEFRNVLDMLIGDGLYRISFSSGICRASFSLG
jgi:hypothetical protein